MVKEGKNEASQPGATIHFSGQSLAKMLGKGQHLRSVKSEEDFPQFLRAITDPASLGLQ